VPYALVHGGGTRVLLLGLAAMPIMVGMTLVFRKLWLYFAGDVCVRERMVVQAGVGLVGSVLGLLPWAWIRGWIYG